MLLLILARPDRVQAITVDDLYVAEVFVTSQEDKQLKSGARAGLLQVLVRVSGTTEVQQSSLIANALRNPASYYFQYSYQSTDRDFLIGDKVVPARILRLHYEPNAIARLLRDSGFPVWGSNRPSVLLWLAVSDEQGRRLLSESDSSEVLTAVNDLANQRGLPLLYPLLDLEDEAQVSTAEVWGSFLARVERASDRYNPGCILSARIQKSDSGQWSASWSYRVDGEWSSFSNIAPSVTDLVSGIVDLLADSLAARYALDSSRSIIELRIDQIDSLSDYAEVTRYLESLTPVLDSSVTEVRGTEVLFRLSTEGQTAQLIKIIEFDEKMMLINTSNQNTLLNYRWLK